MEGPTFAGSLGPSLAFSNLPTSSVPAAFIPDAACAHHSAKPVLTKALGQVSLEGFTTPGGTSINFLMVPCQAPGEVVPRPASLALPLYLHGAVDLGAVKHELEVAQAAQGGLPGQVCFLFDQEEGVVQRQGDGDLAGTGGQTEGLNLALPATPLWEPQLPPGA